tara:strand:- start:288 stop:503 length:216 start_codon:yes stop_codon:yes gene_type:complete
MLTQVHPKLTWLAPTRQANLELDPGVLAAPDLIELVATIPKDVEHLEHLVQPSKIEPVQAQDLLWEGSVLP